MKLHDALRNDSELHEEVVDLFEQERQQALVAIEGAAPTDADELTALKAYLDALRKVRGLFLRGVDDHARRRV